MTRFVSILILSLLGLAAQCQEVIVSNEISIRNRIAYDLIGQIGDRILFFTEKGKEREISVFDEDLVFQSVRQINLDQERVSLIEVMNLDSVFAILYSYRDGQEQIFNLDKFSNTGVRVDSNLVFRLDRPIFKRSLLSVLSDDERFICAHFISNDDELNLVVIDVTTGALVQNIRYKFDDIDILQEHYDVVISNSGTVYLIGQINNFKNRRKAHQLRIYKVTPGSKALQQISLDLSGFVCQDIYLKVNNENQEVAILGLYDEKRENVSSGYFFISGAFEDLVGQSIKLLPFSKSIFLEISSRNNKNRLEGVIISDIIWKRDQTPLLVLEIAYDIFRQDSRNFQTAAYRNRYSPLHSIGWSDHFRDDLILLSLDQDNKEEWIQVLYKKQFSQNDSGAFSSFFPFVTPSRLRLLYNDEIKSSNTVSEYILDSNGNYKRASVLSTEYQDLHLRFMDAIQLSPSSLLVPSQSLYDINIVKISF